MVVKDPSAPLEEPSFLEREGFFDVLDNEPTAEDLETFDQELNTEQWLACKNLQGPLLVVAGPGTGKTRVIAYRFRELINIGLSPESILVLTFTDKAAGEMEERIISLCSLSSGQLAISTFHSFALRFLEAEGIRINNLPQPFKIANDTEKYEIMAQVIEGSHLKFDSNVPSNELESAIMEWRGQLRQVALYRLPRPRDIVKPLLSLFGRCKQEMAGPEQYARYAQALSRDGSPSAETQLTIARIYKAYQEELARAGLIDFDDAICYSAQLLEDDNDLRDQYRKMFPYVMVDEFQDTNYSQMRLIELIAGEGSGNLMVVGDDDQAIYRFRGASLSSLKRFGRIYPRHVEVSLEKNYRSSDPIVRRSQMMILHNKDARLEKSNKALVSGPEIRIFKAHDHLQEVVWQVKQIEELIELGVEPGEIAILGRANAHLRPFIPILQSHNIPHQIYGGRGFWEQNEIRDIRALIQVVADASDSVAMARIMTIPGFDIPAEEIEKLTREAQRYGVALEQVVEFSLLEQTDEILSTRIRVLLDLIKDVRNMATRGAVDDIVNAILVQTGFVGLLHYETEQEKEQIGADLRQFCNVVNRFASTYKNATLKDLVEHLAHVEHSGDAEGLATVDADRSAVQVMTIHQAKGLQFRAVFSPCWVEERFPLKGQSDPLPMPEEFLKEELPQGDAHEAEERRLGYVAVTRAKQFLFLSFANRYGSGNKKWKASRFLVEMGLVTKDGIIANGILDEIPPKEMLADAIAPPAVAIPRDMVVSHSDLSQYTNCPRQYQYAKVYRLPSKESPEMQFGTITHLTLFEILKRNRIQKMGLIQCLELFRENFAKIRFADAGNAASWRLKGEKMIQDLYEKDLLSGGELLEKDFWLKLGELTIRGRIDRIDPVDEEGFQSVIDYKTGNVGGPSELAKDTQMGLYALAAKESLKIPKAQLIVIDVDGVKHSVTKTPSQLEADKRWALEAAKGIAAKHYPAKPNSFKCSHCAYRLLCPEAE